MDKKALKREIVCSKIFTISNDCSEIGPAVNIGLLLWASVLIEIAIPRFSAFRPKIIILAGFRN